MECGVPFCHNGCPLGQPDPRLERPRLPRPLARGDRPAARDQQLPGVHRAAVPGAVRGRVRARDPRGRRGHDQADRGLDHRPRVGRGLGRAAAAARRDRPTVAVVGAGPGGHGGRAAAAPRRPPRHALRARRGRRRARALRRAGLQDREVGRRAARRAARAPRASSFAYGVDVGRDIDAATSCASASTRSSLATGSRVPRDLPVPGRELDGVHFAMDYLYQRNRWVAREHGRAAPTRRARERGSPRRASTSIVIGGGDTGADCVGNSHARGRGVGHPDRAARRAAGAPSRRPHAVAALAAEAAHVSYALKEGGDARLRDLDDQAHGRGRPRRGDPLGRRTRASRRSTPIEGTEATRPADLVLLAMGFLHPEQAAARAARRRDGPARQRQGGRRTRARSRASSPRATPAAASR